VGGTWCDCFDPVAPDVSGDNDMIDKIAAILIFILLAWWVVDEYIEGVEFDRVMDEHHAHFMLVSDWRDEWRLLTETYLAMWEAHHPPPDCDKDG